MSNNINQEGMGAEIEEFMDNFKQFIEDNGGNPEKYDDLAYQVIELMALHDSYVSEIMKQQKQQIKQDNPQKEDKITKQQNSNTEEDTETTIINPDF